MVGLSGNYGIPGRQPPAIVDSSWLSQKKTLPPMYGCCLAEFAQATVPSDMPALVCAYCLDR